MRISRSLYDEIVAHARADAPDECCGMIASRDGDAVAVHRARNLAASPLRYEVHSEDLYRILDGIEEQELDLGAIYHSHTRSDPIPSQTDINLAVMGEQRVQKYPGTLYVIVGVKGDQDDVRAWDIHAGGYTEQPLEIVED
jgi:proteasome lid subunit RPN8/RPN11